MNVFSCLGLPNCFCVLVYIFILLAFMAVSLPVLRGGDGRGIKDGKAAALIEGVEVLGVK